MTTRQRFSDAVAAAARRLSRAGWDSMTAARRAALGYARSSAGMSSHAIPRTKKPLTEHGFKDASTDPAAIGEWWGKWPKAMIGVATGASGLVVLDVDVDQAKGIDGEASLKALLNGITLPADLTVARTPRGGRHIYFTARDDLVVRNTAASLGADSIPAARAATSSPRRASTPMALPTTGTAWGHLPSAPDWLAQPHRPEHRQARPAPRSGEPTSRDGAPMAKRHCRRMRPRR